MRSDIGLHNLKHLWKGIVENMLGVLRTYLDQRWFYSCLFSGLGWGECSTVGTGAALILAFKRSHNFQKCAFLKLLLSTLMMVVIKPKAYVLIII
jgi:hypothetical protein